MSKQSTANELTSIEASFFSGPIPHPSLLAEYERICPGSADKILIRFEKQSDHRMHLERSVVVGNSRRSTLGLVLGFIICLLMVGAAVYLGIHGHDVLAGTIVASTLASVVGTFVYGKSSASHERMEKNAVLQTPKKD